MKCIRCIVVVCLAVLLWSCSSTKHVPRGQLLLDKVTISVDNDSIKTTELYNFLRQQPNHKVLGFAKLQLATYSLSGRDSTKWYNRWLQKIGQAPVVYDEKLTQMSQSQLRQALVNRGYLGATVEVDTTARRDKRKMDVEYIIHTGLPHYIASIRYNIPDTAIARLFFADTAHTAIRPGELFDRNQLDNFRQTMTTRLRNEGYYAFNKDYITFTADTARGDYGIALVMNVMPPKRPIPANPDQSKELKITDTELVYQEGDDYAVKVEEHYELADTAALHPRYRLRQVIFDTDFSAKLEGGGDRDTVRYRDIEVVYGPDHYIAPSILEEKCYLHPGQEYSALNVERTYEALSQLGILKFINIEMRPAGRADGEQLLDACVMLSRNKKQGVTLELEGTNSEGDLGFGVGATYQHRDIGHRSNLLTVKFRTAYESLSGHMDGFINNRYTEYAGEVGLTFPKFVFPFMTEQYKKRRRATTELSVTGNYQERPEYTRVIAGAAWKYKWLHKRGSRTTRYTYDMVDVNYVRLPRSTINFLDSIAPSNPLLRYSYEDHFIMRMGLNFYMTNKRQPVSGLSAFAVQPSVRTVRGSIEMAGNALYAISSIIGQKKSDGAYKIFGIQYAQYVKAEADYSYALNFNSRNALAFHIGGGVAVPYLNSSMVPFEKRFYAGGANGVRGWSVRTLGPGAYDAKNQMTDFINQCGDILLNMSMEYRAKIFWIFEGALFIDAGNIWTIRNYENQPGGVFKFSQFYKQIAAAYGVGLRLDFTYFLLRFDLGFKAHNPAVNQEQWPLLHPRWSRDATLHFSVGYPF